MFDPLPDSVIEVLRSDETAALTAMLIAGGAFPDILAFATRALAPPKAAAEPPKRARRRRGRREPPDQRDERLVEAMKDSPGAQIAKLVAAIGKSKTSTVTALHRLRDAGRAESQNRVWVLTEPEPPPAPKERWIAPVSAQGGRRRRAEEEMRAEA
jgi:hypothetical protein